ncbi:MAG: thioredoxin domain-containing protein [Nitrospinaceae bacterium]|nr:thioredoxin domain-containing protein [Nitrospinaceae bacterium]
MIRYSPNPNTAHLIRWREWGPEAFESACEQDKPVMLLIGAFWCAFCQRMDETAFSDEEVAALLNAYFVPVRCENAQRPDVDVRYNHNGWPTIIFMAPGGEPLATVNYLDTEDFANVLVRVHTAYQAAKDNFSSAAPPAEVPSTEAPATETTELKVHVPKSDKPHLEAISEISAALMAMADSENGGFGSEHRFPHPEALDFLLYRYETTGEARYLDHVALTLDKLRAGATWDARGGGFFRYSSKPDWSEPHREKLLADHAGVLSNCLYLFRLSGRDEYRNLAGEIVEYMDTTLSAPSDSPASVSFFGCEDFVRPPGGDPASADPARWYSIIDELIYTDANALAASAYFEAARVLERPKLKKRALEILEFLWSHCRFFIGPMSHYFDGEAQAPGLLIDQATTGLAMLDAHREEKNTVYLERALLLADVLLAFNANPSGGFHDIGQLGPAHLRHPLTLVAENGLAARFFFKLAKASGQSKYREAALRALAAFTEDLTPYGVYAASYGRALGELI